MSILGALVRVRLESLEAVAARAGALPGVDIGANPGDGRLVLVLEDVELEDGRRTAAATLESIGLWPEVLNTSLVYEYSGPDVLPDGAGIDYRAWRGRLVAREAGTA